MSEYINYLKIVDDAMHFAVHNILKIVEREGLKQDHHFFISFLTQAPNVKLSERVKAKYPEEITVVLQHQFQDLIVSDNCFSIHLSFDGIGEVVVIPYKAITAFADPEAKFALQFEYYSNNIDEMIQQPQKHHTKIKNETSSSATTPTNVIALDQFRKKKKH
jgi:uncharacterized protein